MQTMNELATKLKALKDAKEQLAQAVKENNAEIEKAEAELANVMLTEGNGSFELNGFKYSLNVKDIFSCLAENRERLIEALKPYGYDRHDIITETIPAQKLNTLMKSVCEENDGETPNEFDGIVSCYEKIGISIRKGKK